MSRAGRELRLDAEGRQQLRQQRSKPIAALRQWFTRQQRDVPDGSATAKAIDYNLARGAALTRYFEEDDLPIDNNHIENLTRPAASASRANGSAAYFEVSYSHFHPFYYDAVTWCGGAR